MKEYMKKSENLFNPVRADQPQLYKEFQAVTTLQYGMIGLIVIVCICLFVILTIAKQPVKYAVIDLSSGKSLPTRILDELSGTIIDKQLVFYSKKSVEDYLNEDFGTIKASREEFMKIISPSAIKNLIPENWLNNQDIQKSYNNRSTCDFRWVIRPRITNKNDPQYSVLCQVERTVKMIGYKPWVTSHCLRLDWARLNNEYDPFLRPHGLVLTNMTAISADSKEFIDLMKDVKE